MPRAKRVCPAGECFHVLNRSVARMTVFEKPADYDAFARVIAEVHEAVPLPILAWAAMPNHWHFVVAPTGDSQVTEFFRLLTVTHTMRWHASHGTGGTGHLYQGRFKSFPVQDDRHLLTVLRYVERNPVSAGLVASCVDWRWGSAAERLLPTGERPAYLSEPAGVRRPGRWVESVDRPQSQKEVEALRLCVKRGRPYGGKEWVDSAAVRLGLESSLRPRGRPRKG